MAVQEGTIQKNQSWGEVVITTPEDLSAATNLKILQQDPDGNKSELGAGSVLDTYSILVTLSDSVKFTWHGKGKIQGYGEIGGRVFYTPWIPFVVGEILE